MKGSNRNIDSIFGTFCKILAFHAYLCNLWRSTVVKLTHCNDDYSINIPYLFENNCALAIRPHYFSVATHYLWFHTERYRTGWSVSYCQAKPDMRVVSLRNVLHETCQFKDDCSVSTLKYPHYTRFSIYLLSAFQKMQSFPSPCEHGETLATSFLASKDYPILTIMSPSTPFLGLRTSKLVSISKVSRSNVSMTETYISITSNQ